MTKTRKKRISRSNNKKNPNKNICALIVAKSLGVDNNVRYLHSIHDVVRAARTKYTVRSRLSAAKAKGKTIGAVRKTLAKLDGVGYIVHTEGHVVLLDGNGKTVVDTQRQKRDTRKIIRLYAIL